MIKTVNLTEAQQKLFKETIEAVNQANAQAQMLVEITNTKRKSLDDLLAMFCLSNGLHKEKVKLDPIAGIATEEVEDAAPAKL